MKFDWTNFTQIDFTGYCANDYPYDYAEGGNFEDTMISMSYEEFQKYAEEKFELFIKIWPYEAASLIEKANEPLNIW